MRTSTQIETASVLVGEEKAVEYVAKAGFDAWDFSMFAMCDYDWRLGAVRPTTHPLAGENYLAFARKLKRRPRTERRRTAPSSFLEVCALVPRPPDVAYCVVRALDCHTRPRRNR